MLPTALPVDVLESTVDWATFWVSLAAAVATLAAVVVAIVQTALSRRDAASAREDARAARQDAAQERRLREHAQLVQRETELRASEVIANAHHDVELQRQALARVEDAERRAQRSALWVDVRSGWTGDEISGDLYCAISVEVSTEKAHLSDVHVLFERAAGLDESMRTPGSGEVLQEMGREELITGNYLGQFTRSVYVWGLQVGDPLHMVVEFTDPYRDRWRLRTFDGSLRLLTRRDIAPVDDA